MDGKLASMVNVKKQEGMREKCKDANGMSKSRVMC